MMWSWGRGLIHQGSPSTFEKKELRRIKASLRKWEAWGDGL